MISSRPATTAVAIALATVPKAEDTHTSGLKQYVGLARPVVVDPILQYASSAMPSGHASNIAAAVTVACVLSALFVRLRARRRLVLVVGVLVALVVGLDRLLLGVHTLTEVVAGYALGLGVGLLAAYVVDPAARTGAGVEVPG